MQLYNGNDEKINFFEYNFFSLHLPNEFYNTMKEKIFLLLLLFSVGLLNAQTSPKLSTDGNEYWYYMQFCNGKSVIQDMGNDANLLTKTKVEGQASQLWKFIGTKDNYIIVSKNGRKINLVSDFYTASSSSSVSFKLISTTNSTYAPAWELQRIGASNAMNQYEGSGIDRKISDWTVADNNNPLIFVAEDPATELIPEISDADTEIWYYIQFKKRGAVLQDMGDGENLKTKIPRRAQRGQLWKITRTSDSYVLESRLGNKIYYSDGFFKTSSTKSSSLKIVFSTSENYAPALELQRVGTTTCMNQWEGAGLERKLGAWTAGDDNNTILFVRPANMTDLQDTNGSLKTYIGCPKIKNLDLPACTSVGDSAFIACPVLANLTFPYSNPPVYGENAFATPAKVYVELDNQNKEIVEKWRNVPEWNEFKWKDYTGIESPDIPAWKISVSGNNLMVAGLTSVHVVRIVSISGQQQHFMPLPDGTLNITLLPGFYVVNQLNKSEKIIITK